MDKKETSHRSRFISFLEENIMLWSDERLEHERSQIFVRWCFDTGDPADLAKFEKLDAELEQRKQNAKDRAIWAAAIKEDPVWREHYEKYLNDGNTTTRTRQY